MSTPMSRVSHAANSTIVSADGRVHALLKPHRLLVDELVKGVLVCRHLAGRLGRDPVYPLHRSTVCCKSSGGYRGLFAIVEALLDRMAAAPPPPRRLAASLAHRSCVAAPPSLVVRLAFRVGTVNGHRSRARHAALRRSACATSFCHLE
eukprot:scaffold117778_cov54-Phaeocystis_antarctica.AAC.1